MTKMPTRSRTYLRNSTRSYVRERQLDERLPIVLVLFEGEGDVERGFVRFEVLMAFGGAPGNRAEDAALLLEGHFQVALFELPRTVDDLDASSREDGPRVAGAKRGQRYDALGHRTGDGAKRQVAVDPQPRHEVLGTERFVGDLVDRAPQLPHPRRLHRQACGLLVPAESRKK